MREPLFTGPIARAWACWMAEAGQAGHTPRLTVD